jgi:hypothetical protein
MGLSKPVNKGICATSSIGAAMTPSVDEVYDSEIVVDKDVVRAEILVHRLPP